MQAKAMLYSTEDACRAGTIELPDTPPAGADIVEVYGCGFCGTDGHIMDGSVPPQAFRKGTTEIVLGHEIIGKSVTTGKWVIVPAVLGCGKCLPCTSGRSNLCENGIMLGSDANGGFAEYLPVQYAHNLCVLPDDIESRIGFPISYLSIVADALATPYHAVFNQAGIKPGDRVVVGGSGGLGINVIQMAMAAGAHVVGLDLLPEKIANLAKVGAQGVCTKRDGDPRTVFKAIQKEVCDKLGGTPTHCFEVAGHPDVFGLMFGLVGRGGTIIIVGYTSTPASVVYGNIMAKELSISGVWGCPYQDYSRVVDMVLSERIQVEPLVTGTFRLSELDQAFVAIKKPTTIRSVVIPDRVFSG